MSVNDSCRLCSTNLRIHGIICHSRLIFDSKDKDVSVYDQLSKLGLVLDNTPLRSSRICRKCFTVIARLQRDKEVIDEWRKQEILETCQESCVSSTDDHTPSGTTETKSTDKTLPSLSTVTEKPYGCPDCNKSFIHAKTLQRHQRLHTGENVLRCPQCDRPFSQPNHLRNHLRKHRNTPKCVSSTDEPPSSATPGGATEKSAQSTENEEATQSGDDGQSPMPTKEELDESIIKVIIGTNTEGTEDHNYFSQAEDQGLTQLKRKPYGCPDQGLTQLKRKPYGCPDCNKSFSNAALLQTHQRLHTGENVLRCPQCDRPFTLAAQLERHLRAHTRPPKSLKCSQCEKPFTSLRYLHMHQNKLNDVKPAQCPHCDIVLSRTTCIKYHRGKHLEGTQQYECSHCGKLLSSATKLKDHQRIHGEKPYKCPLCHAAFMRPSSLASHRLKHTGETPFKCCQCSSAFRCKSSLKHHKRTHDDDVGGQLCRCAQCEKTFAPPTRLTSLEKRRHKCAECGKAFERLPYLRLHLRTHTRERPFRCGQCERTFARESQLETHQKSHQKATCISRKATGASQLKMPPKVQHASRCDLYQCCRCDRTFGQKKGLWVHRKEAHADAEPCGCPQCHRIRPHECSECGKCFRVLSALRSHQKSHSEERPYVCSECGKSFARPGGLRNHKRTHSEAKPFVCSDCGKRFNFPADLRRHRRSHIGELPYTCVPCGKTFLEAGALRNHLRVHSGKKPFLCSICGKAFWVQHCLIRHQLVHTGAKPYLCAKCGRAFTRKTGLATHRCSVERHPVGTQDSTQDS